MTNAQEFGDRVWHLRELSRDWIRRSVNASSRPHGHALDYTLAYCDLMFAFGFARLNNESRCVGLQQNAAQVLTDAGAVHKVLLAVLEHRIRTANEPNAPALPASLAEAKPAMTLDQHDAVALRTEQYAVDFFISHFRILNTGQRADLWQPWRNNERAINEQLKEIDALGDSAERGKRIFRLIDSESTATKRIHLLKQGLARSGRLSQTDCLVLIERVLACRDSLRAFGDVYDCQELMDVIGRAAELAARCQAPRALESAIEMMLEALAVPNAAKASLHLSDMVGDCFRAIRQLDRWELFDGLAPRMADAVIRNRTIEAMRSTDVSWWIEQLTLLMRIAEAWLTFFGEVHAQPILDEARRVLLSSEYRSFVPKRAKLAAAYITALGQASGEVGFQRMEEIFGTLRPLNDTFSINSYYSASQLQVVEATVWACLDRSRSAT